MKLIKTQILNQNLDFFKDELKRFPYLKSVSEHYRLLVYLTKQFDKISIIDAGTSFGHSGLALAQNHNNTVFTYDIYERSGLPCFKGYDNIKCKCMDINLEDSSFLKSIPIILLDIDPHDGIQEKRFTDRLLEIDYRGYLICDDINLNDKMKRWWNSIDIEKYDVSEVGHFSGTGIINFHRNRDFSIIESE